MTDSELREQVARYVHRETSLRDFQEWFIAATWGDDSREDDHVATLNDFIELRLAEYTSGHWTEEELRDQHLAPVARTRLVEFSLNAPPARASSRASSARADMHEFTMPRVAVAGR